MKRMTQEQIDRQKAYFKQQIAVPTGKYTDFVIRTYYYILQCCRREMRNWCYGKEVSDRNLAKFAYQNVYNGRVDHMGGEIVGKIKELLCAMGYIAFKKEDEQWRIYLKKELDFLPCSIDEYMVRKTEKLTCEKSDKTNEIVQYLVKEGIKIYQFHRICWKCGAATPIYSYYLDVQIRNEMNSRYLLKDRDLNCAFNDVSTDFLDSRARMQLFSEIGIGVIEKIDRCLADKIPTIGERYSKTMDKSYFMNICEECRSVQGINFTVYHPKEIENLGYDELKKACFFKIYPQECGLNKDDISRFVC